MQIYPLSQYFQVCKLEISFLNQKYLHVNSPKVGRWITKTEISPSNDIEQLRFRSNFKELRIASIIILSRISDWNPKDNAWRIRCYMFQLWFEKRRCYLHISPHIERLRKHRQEQWLTQRLLVVQLGTSS